MGNLLSNEERTMKPIIDPRLPRFPVIEEKPTLNQIKEAIRMRDFYNYAFIVASSAVGGWFIPGNSLSPLWRRRCLIGTTSVGGFLGLLMLHDFGEARLRGYAENDVEVEHFNRKYAPKQDL